MSQRFSLVGHDKNVRAQRQQYEQNMRSIDERAAAVRAALAPSSSPIDTLVKEVEESTGFLVSQRCTACCPICLSYDSGSVLRFCARPHGHDESVDPHECVDCGVQVGGEKWFAFVPSQLPEQAVRSFIQASLPLHHRDFSQELSVSHHIPPLLSSDSSQGAIVTNTCATDAETVEEENAKFQSDCVETKTAPLAAWDQVFSSIVYAAPEEPKVGLLDDTNGQMAFRIRESAVWPVSQFSTEEDKVQLYSVVPAYASDSGLSPTPTRGNLIPHMEHGSSRTDNSSKGSTSGERSAVVNSARSCKVITIARILKVLDSPT